MENLTLVKIGETLKNNPTKRSEFVEFMENNVEFIEDIITAYHKTKIQLNQENVDFLNHHVKRHQTNHNLY